MIQAVAKQKMSWFGTLLVILIALMSHSGHSQEDTNLYFVGMVGESIEGESPVLLRWFSNQVDVGIEQFRIYRKPGAANSNSPMVLISETERLRNAAVIQTLFDQPEFERAKDDLLNILFSIAEAPIDEGNFVEELVAVLDAEDNCDSCDFRRNMLIQSNYGAAVVEGMGYVDRVEPGVYTYELRALLPTLQTGEEETVVGRVTVRAFEPTRLPPPRELQEVQLEGIRGHLKVYLRWEKPDNLEIRQMALFGYNIFRYNGNPPNLPFNELLENGELMQINDLPILTPAQNATDAAEDEDYFFVDTNQTLTTNGLEGEPFEGNEQLTYWVVARDLFGVNGEVSEPLGVTVREQQKPQTPQQVEVRVNPVDLDPVITVQWARNNDDTAMYRVYRYRRFRDTRQKGPFPPFQGLTLGQIAEVPQEEFPHIQFTDLDINIADHEQLVFWYCVSAVDDSGNESYLSEPHRGVLLDHTPPEPPHNPLICTQTIHCNLDTFTMEFPNEAEDDSSVSKIRMEFVRLSNQIGSLHVTRKLLFNDELIESDLGTISFQGDQPLILTDEMPVLQLDQSVSYEVESRLSNGRSCASFQIVRDENEQSTLRDKLTKGLDVNFFVKLGIQLEEECVPTEPGVDDHVPRTEGGGRTPVRFAFPQSDPDQEGIILYRSEDCENYHVVSREEFDDETQSVIVEDDYAPDQGGTVCYAYQTYDENGNPSAIVYIPTQVRFQSDPNTRIPPIVTKAEPTGNENAPGVNLSWVGPVNHIAGYLVHFSDIEEVQANEASVFLPPEHYTVIEDLRTMNASIFRTEDIANTPLEPHRGYWISVSSVYEDGQVVSTLNPLYFLWSAEPEPENSPRWPSRNSPPNASGLAAMWLPRVVDPIRPLQEGVGVRIGIADFGSGEIEEIFSTPPFLVYRKRVDKPDRQFKQIGPLIEPFGLNENGEVDNPFVHARLGVFEDEMGIPKSKRVLYFFDQTNLIAGAKYIYRLVELDGTSGEITTERGPSNEVEVTP